MAVFNFVVLDVRVIDIGLHIGEQSEDETEPDWGVEYIPLYLWKMHDILDKLDTERPIGLHMDTNVCIMGIDYCKCASIYDMVQQWKTIISLFKTHIQKWDWLRMLMVQT